MKEKLATAEKAVSEIADLTKKLEESEKEISNLRLTMDGMLKRLTTSKTGVGAII